MRNQVLCWLAVSLPLVSCAVGPDTTPAPDPSIEAEALRRQREVERDRKRREDFQVVLLDLDKLLDKYAGAMMRSGQQRQAVFAASLAKALRDRVKANFDALVRAADDARYPANRAIAVGALGFSNRKEALDPLLNALQAEDEVVVRNALFGLAELEDPRTPLVPLARIMEDDEQPLKTRIGASYALMRIQSELHAPERVLPIWERTLRRPMGEVDAAILVHALRGLGLARESKYAELIAPYTKHPTPLVRCAAAVALGRSGATDSYESLLRLIGPAETNTNVRLFARKALQALAGDVDRAYDVEEWRKVFERGGGNR